MVKEVADWMLDNDMRLIQEYMEREELSDTVRRLTIQALVLEAKEPERIKELLKPILEEFVVRGHKQRNPTSLIQVAWVAPKKPSKGPKKRKNSRSK